MKQTTIRLPDEKYEQLQEEAARRGYSLNHYILLLIEKGEEVVEKGG